MEGFGKKYLILIILILWLTNKTYVSNFPGSRLLTLVSIYPFSATATL